jgi:hypothetical protein
LPRVPCLYHAWSGDPEYQSASFASLLPSSLASVSHTCVGARRQPWPTEQAPCRCCSLASMLPRVELAPPLAPPRLSRPSRVLLHLHRSPPPSMRPSPSLFHRCRRLPPELLVRHHRLPWLADLGSPRAKPSGRSDAQGTAGAHTALLVGPPSPVLAGRGRSRSQPPVHVARRPRSTSGRDSTSLGCGWASWCSCRPWPPPPATLSPEPRATDRLLCLPRRAEKKTVASCLSVSLRVYDRRARLNFGSHMSV